MATPTIPICLKTAWVVHRVLGTTAFDDDVCHGCGSIGELTYPIYHPFQARHVPCKIINIRCGTTAAMETMRSC